MPSPTDGTTADRRRFLLRAGGALLAPLLAGPALAAPDVAPIEARYRATVAGVPIAELSLLVVVVSNELTRLRLTIETVGVAAAWSGGRSQLVTLARIDGEAPPLPVRFDSRQVKSDRERTVAIRYDANGGITEVALTTRGRPRESDVPPALREGTVDPLTAFVRLRRWLAAAVEGRAAPEVTVPIFDGRKRLDLEARYSGRTTVRRSSPVPAHELEVRLVGRFGFEEDDSLIQLPDGERPAPLRVLVSADEDLLPLRLEVPARRMAPVIELVRA